jgi:hypothetical protein
MARTSGNTSRTKQSKGNNRRRRHRILALIAAAAVAVAVALVVAIIVVMCGGRSPEPTAIPPTARRPPAHPARASRGRIIRTPAAPT